MSEDVSVCFSGGAKGADSKWGIEAAKHGHSVMHFTFAGYRSDVPNDTIIQLTNEELSEADQYLQTSNLALQRRIPTDSYKLNLLRRNYYQIVHSQTLYAVSDIKNQQVQGGTAWAVQMFINRRLSQPGSVPAYVFDQKLDKWFRYHHIMKWIETTDVPKPSGLYTGIGARNLTDMGAKAIEDLYHGSDISERKEELV
jgi:hypothetical protein